MAVRTPTQPDPDDSEQPSIGFRWSDLFPDAHPERRRTPRERSLFFTAATVLFLVAWIAGFVGPFASISGRWADEEPKASILLATAMAVPAIVGAAAMIYGIIRFRRRQLSWPIPLIGAGIILVNMVLMFFLASLH